MRFLQQDMPQLATKWLGLLDFPEGDGIIGHVYDQFYLNLFGILFILFLQDQKKNFFTFYLFFSFDTIKRNDTI